jgi:hypothetical protein
MQYDLFAHPQTARDFGLETAAVTKDYRSPPGPALFGDKYRLTLAIAEQGCQRQCQSKLA